MIYRPSRAIRLIFWRRCFSGEFYGVQSCIRYGCSHVDQKSVIHAKDGFD